MPRLPTLDDLGPRPIPRSNRTVATVRNAGAVGEALEGFGQTTARIGQQMIEKEDRLAYAAAKTAVLKADITARKELEEDPDYENWETKYAERMKSAREQATSLIKSRSDRAMFEQEASVDIARGASVLSSAASGRRRDARLAMGQDALAELSDIGQNAPDDATRYATIENAGQLIQGLVDDGTISASDAGKLRRGWTQNYVVQRIETLRAAGDLSGAQDFFDANRNNIDASTEIRLNSQISDAIENRENLLIAEDIVHAPTVPSGTPDRLVPDMAKMITITARSESGNRERDRSGRLVTSSAGAQGRMQVMPATARDPGHGIRPWDGKTDEDRSRVGEELLAALMEKYGDPAKAWAAYNWGEGRVDKAISRHGDRWLDYAPDETRSYVRKNVSALGGATQVPAQHDLNRIYSQIDERAEQEGWTPERREAVKSQAARLVERDEGLDRREKADAYELALEKSEQLRENFTDVSQLGDAYYRASETQQRTLRNIADANRRATASSANGDVVRALHRMEIEAPGQFAGLDLRPYRAFMTPGEYDEVSTSQARTLAQAGKWSPRTGISSAIDWGEKFGGVEITRDEDRYRVYRYIENRALQFREESKGKAPAESDYQRWFREIAGEVTVKRSLFGVDTIAPDATLRAYKTPASSALRKQITREFRKVNGRDPTEDEIKTWFERMGEEIR